MYVNAWLVQHDNQQPGGYPSGNPLFIPEARGGAIGAANVFWALGQHGGLGFSPFGIDGFAGRPEPAPRLNVEFPVRRTLPEGVPRMPMPERGYGIAINTAPDEYVVAGAGFNLRFAANVPGPRIAAIGSIDEGSFAGGKWLAERRLNGDESGGGTAMFFRGLRPGIQKVRLYRHD